MTHGHQTCPAMTGCLILTWLAGAGPALAQELVTRDASLPAAAAMSMPAAGTASSPSAHISAPDTQTHAGSLWNADDRGGPLERAARRESARLELSPAVAPGVEPAKGQTGPSLASIVPVGARVRVRMLPAQHAVTGIVLAVDDTHLSVAPEGAFALKIPVESITALDLSVGRKRHWLLGLGIGAASGVAIGFASSVDPFDCGYDSPNFCTRGEAVGASVFGMSLLGTGIGALVNRERWLSVPVRLSPPASSAAAPSRADAGAVGR